MRVKFIRSDPDQVISRVPDPYPGQPHPDPHQVTIGHNKVRGFLEFVTVK